MKPFILKLPDDLHKAIKRMAFENEESMQQYIIGTLNKNIKKR